MVYSTTSAEAIIRDGDAGGQAGKQLSYAVIGVIGLFIIAGLRPGVLTRIAPLALAGSAALLLAVLIAPPTIAPTINGAARWLVLGGVQLQPSEVAKLALVLWIAMMVARDPKSMTTPRGMAPYAIVTSALALLVIVQPDLGTTGIIVMTAFVMAFVAGAPLRNLGIIAGSVAFLVVCVVAANDYQRARVVAFLNPWADPTGQAYQNVQAQIAIGSGGIFGRGLGNSIQKNNYLPEAQTDMIGAIIGEELGLIGLLGLIAAFVVIGVMGFRIALRARDVHGRLVAAGATALICLQAAINLAQVFGALPITGVPLPFVSAGGTSIVVFLAAVGVLINTSRHGAAARARSSAARPATRGDRGGGDGRSRQTGAGDRRRIAS